MLTIQSMLVVNTTAWLKLMSNQAKSFAKLRIVGLQQASLRQNFNSSLQHWHHNYSSCDFPTTVTASGATPACNRFLKLPQQRILQVRQIFWLLYSAVNKLDNDRIKEIGPDRACAEWLVKCGAHVRFDRHNKFIKSYNQLGVTTGSTNKLREVEAEEATIMSIGFPHFKNITDLKRLSFKRCTRLDDSCLSQIVQHLSDCLEELEIISSGDISDQGLQKLSGLKKLKKLNLFELPGVRNKEAVFELLKQNLSECEITFEDHNGFYKSTTV